MGFKILALTENTIGAQLLLSTHLEVLGHEVTLLSRPEELRERLTTERYDWLILDEAAVRPAERQVMEDVPRSRGRAGIVWLGLPPRDLRISVDAIFAKPLRYSEIAGFFARGKPQDAGLVRGVAGRPGERPPGRAKAGTPPPAGPAALGNRLKKQGTRPWLRKP